MNAEKNEKSWDFDGWAHRYDEVLDAVVETAKLSGQAKFLISERERVISHAYAAIGRPRFSGWIHQR